MGQLILITGGAGFFGDILKRRLLDIGARCVSIDLNSDNTIHPNLTAIQADIRDSQVLKKIFDSWRFDAIIHCAAILAHASESNECLWSCNVTGTFRIAEFANQYRVPKVIFTSSNCLWGNPFHRDVTEDDPPEPVELYGRSKWQAENSLLNPQNYFKTVVFRCPTIIGSGRLGLLAMLFEFIDDNRTVWVVGQGNNRYQFIYAQDLVDACLRALNYPETDVFNIGSDNVKPMREIYENLIKMAGKDSRVTSLPRWPSLMLMRLAHYTNISPLGPYHYRMIAESFVFDTSKIKRKLNWSPTLTNEQMLFEAYRYYRSNRSLLHTDLNCSAHRKPAPMGVVKLLKWIS